MPQIFEVTLALNAPAVVPLPRLASPKLDGVRVYVRGCKVWSRRNKLIPNRYVQRLFGTKQLEGFDGELIVGNPTAKEVFQRTMSGVTSVEGEPDVRLWAFDHIDAKGGFEDRQLAMKYVAAALPSELLLRVVLVPQLMIKTQSKLELFVAKCLELGFEGVMLRVPDAPYKIGRCGETTPYLLRIKPRETGEMTITGFEELMHNDNPASVNEMGRTKRSSSKAGRRGGGTLGKFVGDWVDEQGKVWVIKVGTGKGMTAEFRQHVWNNRRKFMGKKLTFEFQRAGMKDRPRSPSAVGIRWKGDA